MAYGIAINTIFGFKAVTNQRVPKFVSSVSILSTDGRSGSFTAPSGVTSSTGFAFSTEPSVVVSFSGSTVFWEYADAIFTSTNFEIIVVRI